jgi:hypothetical protein
MACSDQDILKQVEERIARMIASILERLHDLEHTWAKQEYTEQFAMDQESWHVLIQGLSK